MATIGQLTTSMGHSSYVIESSTRKGVVCLCLFLLFGFWFLKVNLLCIVVTVLFIRIKLVTAHITKEIVDGLGEYLIRNEHTNLNKSGQPRITMRYFFHTHVERIRFNLEEVKEATRFRR